MKSRPGRALWLLFALLPFLSETRLVAQIDEYTTDLEITHRKNKGKVDVKFRDRVELNHDVTKPIRVKARPKEQVNIIIKDPLTLLFDYKAGEKTETNTADFDALAKFLSVITPDITAAAPSGGAGPKFGESVDIIAGSTRVAYPAITEELDHLVKVIGGIQKKVNDAITQQPDPQFPSARDEKAIEAVGKLADILDQMAASLSAGTETAVVRIETAGSVVAINANEFLQARERLQSKGETASARQQEARVLQAAVVALDKKMTGDLTEMGAKLAKARHDAAVARHKSDATNEEVVEARIAPAAIDTEEKQKLEARADLDSKAANDAAIAMRTAEQEFASAAMKAKISQEQLAQANAEVAQYANAILDSKAGLFLARVFLVRAEIRAGDATAKKFVTDYRAFRSAVENGVHIATLPPKNDKEITQKVEVTAKASYNTGKVATDHQTTFVGSYSLVVAPKQSFHMRAGAGAIYSFVENPEYSVATAADGTLSIAEKSSSSNALSAAVTLNFYPDRYFGEAVEPFIQIGYSPLKDVQGILLGGGGTFFGTTQLSAGIIYQQRRTLKSGLSVGMPLDKVEDLFTEKEWEPGLYVQVSIPIPFTK